LPTIQKALESPSQWNPTRDTEVALDLYEYLQEKARLEEAHPNKKNDPSRRTPDTGHVFSDEAEDRHTQERLVKVVKKELILDTIHPRLQSALSHWKPTLRQRNKIGKLYLENRLDLWILPWLPHIDHPAILPNLLSDCKRKIKSALSYLQRKTASDMDFLQASLDTLRPWQGVFDPKILQRLVSETVTPSLARYLAKQRKIRATEKDWTGLKIAREMHTRGLLSDIEYLSVIEGELLMNWASTMHAVLVDKKDAMSTAVTSYREWKVQVLVNPIKLDGNASLVSDRSTRLLQEDGRICGIFYSVLRMIQIAKTSSEEGDGLGDLQPPRSNYHVVVARRAKERQLEVQDDFVRMESRSASETEARIRLQRRNMYTPTFREVVEEFAKERGIMFQPRMGAKSLKDGKKVFLFGEVPIYMEGDVVYALKDSDWRPLSLEHLSASATKSF
jgi:hypothetical protein